MNKRRVSHVSGGETLSLQGLPPSRLPGRKHWKLQQFFPAFAGGERGRPSRAGKLKQTQPRYRPDVPARLQVHSTQRLRRRIRSECPQPGRCGPAAHRSVRLRATLFVRYARARRAQTEWQLRVEIGRCDLAGMPRPNDAPPLLLKEATTASDPARKAGCNRDRPPVVRRAWIRSTT